MPLPALLQGFAGAVLLLRRSLLVPPLLPRGLLVLPAASCAFCAFTSPRDCFHCPFCMFKISCRALTSGAVSFAGNTHNGVNNKYIETQDLAGVAGQSFAVCMDVKKAEEVCHSPFRRSMA